MPNRLLALVVVSSLLLVPIAYAADQSAAAVPVEYELVRRLNNRLFWSCAKTPYNRPAEFAPIRSNLNCLFHARQDECVSDRRLNMRRSSYF